MVVHGGYCGESKVTLEDFDLFDLDKKHWVNAICKKSKENNDKKESNDINDINKKTLP